MLLLDPLELWGGVECTVNRVGDHFFDQMERNGHAWRDDDLERFAALGLRALRYPLLWERLAPEQARVTDWSWADRRLDRLRELGIRPIVGLVHHGSGPRRTNLLDPGFAEGLADFARQVAERYPWVEDYTPVNEPLTTARFSALYGHWYPHAHDDRSFARAFLNQCWAVALSMQAIRTVNPAARLVQTEDLGKVFSTPALAGQAEFENQRRWLTFDLLGGHLNEKHPLWAYLRAAEVAPAELHWFLDSPCPPDLLGINYYVTSERFLDERMDRYPAYSHGSSCADMPAVRVNAAGVNGIGRLLREAWERYGLPLAVTEAQLNCTRDEQMRWFVEIWRDARALREREDVDVRAVTLWALLGAFNWTNLLTRDDPASYEPGAFDLRGPVPRPTALAALAQTLARDGQADHPVLRMPGWWKRPERFVGEPATAYQAMPPPVRPAEEESSPAPLLITGNEGPLAHAFRVVCRDRALPAHFLHCREQEGTDLAAARTWLDRLQPWAVIHAPDVPAAESRRDDPRRCQYAHVELPLAWAQACAERGLPLLIFSSSQVFDARAHTAHDEGTALHPAGVYGRSQVEGERGVLSTLPTALVIRTDVQFGPWHDGDLVWRALQAVGENQTTGLPVNGVFTLTYLPDLVHACLDLLLDRETGVWHLSNAGTLDHAMFRACAVEIMGTGVPADGHVLCKAGQMDAEPAGHSALISRRAALLPPWQSAVRRLAHTKFPSLEPLPN